MILLFLILETCLHNISECLCFADFAVSLDKETQMIKIQRSLFRDFLWPFEERLFVYDFSLWEFISYENLLNLNGFNTISLYSEAAAEVVVGVFEPWWPLGSLHCLWWAHFR